MLHTRVRDLQNEITVMRTQHLLGQPSPVMEAIPRYKLEKKRTGTPAYKGVRDEAFELPSNNAHRQSGYWSPRTPPSSDFCLDNNSELNFGVQAIMVEEDGDSDSENDDLCTPRIIPSMDWWLRPDELCTPPPPPVEVAECSPDCPPHKSLLRPASMPDTMQGKRSATLSLRRRIQSLKLTQQTKPPTNKVHLQQPSTTTSNCSFLEVALPTSPFVYGSPQDSGWEVVVPVGPTMPSCATTWVIQCPDATAV